MKYREAPAATNRWQYLYFALAIASQGVVIFFFFFFFRATYDFLRDM
jgi:hypothetical protein